MEINRRTFTTVAAAGLGGVLVGATQMSAEDSEKAKSEQYEICKQRGHVPTSMGNMHVGFTTTGFTAIPDSPRLPYQQRTETPWETCFYCGKQYRFVTNFEEK